MSDEKISIPNSGGITMSKVKDFSSYKIIYMYAEPPQTELTRFDWSYGHHNGNGFGKQYSGRFPDGISRGLVYPGDYSFNLFLSNSIKRGDKLSINPKTPFSYLSFFNYLQHGGVVPSITPISQGDSGIGTIPNPRGGKVIKVAYFDELKTIWNRYYHKKSYTDFKLNEFLTKNLRNTPHFNLEAYLKTESKSWADFKAQYPNAGLKEFSGEHQDGDYNIYYQDTPIEVLGDHPVENSTNRL